jgi:hypothetical protein
MFQNAPVFGQTGYVYCKCLVIPIQAVAHPWILLSNPYELLKKQPNLQPDWDLTTPSFSNVGSVLKFDNAKKAEVKIVVLILNLFCSGCDRDQVSLLYKMKVIYRLILCVVFYLSACWTLNTRYQRSPPRQILRQFETDNVRHCVPTDDGGLNYVMAVAGRNGDRRVWVVWIKHHPERPIRVRSRAKLNLHYMYIIEIQLVKRSKPTVSRL